MGEAGYKYGQEADSVLMREYNRRSEGHPFTKGSDCNMLCYDYFYGLDMPLLAMEVMNNGFSGLAVWMLDDAMHSNGDTGRPEDLKIWGFWNILGNEVFHRPEEEQIRPWYYTWSLMCRYFPAGCNIVRTDLPAGNGIYAVAAIWQGYMTVAMVNISKNDASLRLHLPSPLHEAALYVYEENKQEVDPDGYPVPVQTGISIEKDYECTLKANSFKLLTNIQYKE